MTHKIQIIGNEYDVSLLRAIVATLREFGAVEIDEQWGLAGSQEIDTLRVTIGNEPIAVEAETYIGVSVSGEAEVVDRIVERVRERVGSHL